MEYSVVISQKMVLFITTALKTSNSTDSFCLEIMFMLILRLVNESVSTAGATSRRMCWKNKSVHEWWIDNCLLLYLLTSQGRSNIKNCRILLIHQTYRHHNFICKNEHQTNERSKIANTFWEELIAHFPLTRHGPHRKLHLHQCFVATGTFLPSCYLATIGGYIGRPRDSHLWRHIPHRKWRS
jgi:hypothetical protein